MKRIPLILLSLLILLAGLGAGVYAYTGPNRTVTQAYDYWHLSRWVTGYGWDAMCTIYSPPPEAWWNYTLACLNFSATDFPGCTCDDYYQAATGNPAYRLVTLTGTTTITYPPATVSGVTTCTDPGANGWCTGGASLQLSANEPLAGYQITGIESTDGMLCSTSGASITCTWPFPEGESGFSFWAISSYGDTSLQASTNLRLDSQSPILSLEQSGGIHGQNGWYVAGPVSVQATASDLTSGLAGTWSQLDGGPWQPGSSQQVTGDGVYSLAFRAEDLAGLETIQTMTVRLDSTSPAFSFSLPPVDGENGWYVSLVNASFIAADATSGLAEAGVSLDGLDWQPAISLEDGTHQLQGMARDLAGNETTLSATVQVDTQPPQAVIIVPDVDGQNGWHVTPVTVSALAIDATSGLAWLEMRLDGGDWQAVDRLDILDGVHDVSMRAQDIAGHVTTLSRSLQVDSQPPQSAFIEPLEGSETVVKGLVTFSGSSLDLASGLSGVAFSLDTGISWQALTPDLDGNWEFAWDTTTVPNGTYTILVRAVDRAGNEENTARVKVIVSNPPPVVQLPESSLASEAIPLTILPQGIPLGGARLAISDPARRYPTLTLEFTLPDLPETFAWDGRFAGGQPAAPGTYAILLEAWDVFGNTGRASGQVLIQSNCPGDDGAPETTLTPVATRLPWKPVVTTTPTASPAPTSTPTTTVLPGLPPSPEPSATTTSVGVAVDAYPGEPPASPARPRLIWPVYGLVALMAVLASASLSDPRPRALRRLEQTLQSIQTHNDPTH